MTVKGHFISLEKGFIIYYPEIGLFYIEYVCCNQQFYTARYIF